MRRTTTIYKNSNPARITKVTWELTSNGVGYMMSQTITSKWDNKDIPVHLTAEELQGHLKLLEDIKQFG